MKLARSLILTITAVSTLAVARPVTAAEDDPGVWLITVFSDRMPFEDRSPWRYWLEAQLRYPDIGSGANQLLFRPAIGYDFSPSVSALFGYARFRTHPASGATTTEDRFWQHVAWRFHAEENYSLSMRLRLEQRMPSTGSDTGHFLRYQLKYVRKVGTEGTTDFIASVEPFWDLRDTDYGATSGLSQLRVYVGFGFRLGAQSALDVGYQNQHIYRDARPDRVNHLAMLNFKSKF